jgi:enolase-phosphatase E1
MPPPVRAILVDVEGTTSSIEYVVRTLFPFARARMADFLRARWETPEVRDAVGRMGPSLGTPELAAAEALRLMDRDAKETGLKALQGLIWRDGYAAGLLRSHVYPDVPPALRRWNDRALDVRVYSSGSEEAQRQFFRHTEAGDLLPFFRGHYDTRMGSKRQAASYRAIAADLRRPPAEILFLSDVLEELLAAAAAGLQVVLVIRPGNPTPPLHGLPEVVTFDAVLP